MTAVAGTVFIAAGAFWLSFTSLADLAAREQELTDVASVTLELGEVSGAIPHELVSCWNWAVKRTELLPRAALKKLLVTSAVPGAADTPDNRKCGLPRPLI